MVKDLVNTSTHFSNVLKCHSLRGYSSLPTSKNRKEARLDENKLLEETEGTLCDAGIAD